MEDNETRMEELARIIKQDISLFCIVSRAVVVFTNIVIDDRAVTMFDVKTN